MAKKWKLPRERQAAISRFSEKMRTMVLLKEAT